MKQYFINPETLVLRAGWRIIAFLAIFAAIAVPVMIGATALLGGLEDGGDSGPGILGLTLLAIAASTAVSVTRRFVDKKTVQSLGLSLDRFALLDVLSGVVISAFIMAGAYFIMIATGLIQFNGFTWWSDGRPISSDLYLLALAALGGVLLRLTIIAWWEELVFRGYLLQNMIDGMGILWSVILTSLLFAGVHFFNPGATLLTTFLLAVTTPILIYAYLKTGQLWLPIGLHLGWNFFQSAIFGFASSGQVIPSMISQSPIGPDWLTGGQFGAEGSVLIFPLAILSCFAIHYWVRKTRHPEQGLLEVVV